MRLPNSNISTETANTLSSSSFGIGDAGVILEILRTKIYKNPILAICREITCNARDAHREVGTPNKPIEIHLPHHWSTNLIIKDYGPGISPDRMENIFVNFGSSTKRLDNVQTGGFGLGAKTPFAYSDIFTIRTVFNGVKYVYSAYIDESKVGKMTLLHQDKTDEPNSTAIEIPVLKNDYETFAKQIVNVTQHWDVKPNIHGDTIPAWKLYTYNYSGDGWKYPQPEKYIYYYNSPKPLAIVDGIPYSIDPYNGISQANDQQKTVLNIGFHIWFNVGELSLAASRDNIHYDDNTQKIILERANGIIKDLNNIISNEIENANSYTEACNTYAKFINNFNKDNICNIANLKWKGHPVKRLVDSSHIGEWARLLTYTYNKYKKKVSCSSKDSKILFRDSSNLLFHFDLDRKSIPSNFIKRLFNTTDCTSIQVLWTEDNPSSTKYQFAKNRAEFKKDPAPKVEYNKDFMKVLGFKSLQEAFDKAPKEQKARRQTRKKAEDGKVMGYNLTVRYNKIIAEPSAHDNKQGGIYITVDRKDKTYLSGDEQLTTNMVYGYKNYLDKPIIGFTKFKEKKLESNWVKLLDAVKAKVEKDIFGTSIEEINKANIASNYIFRHTYPYITSLLAYPDKLNDNSILKEYIEESLIVEDINILYKNIIPVLEKLGYSITSPVFSEYSVDLKIDTNCKLAKLRKKVLERYPLLSCIRYVDDYEPAIDYINMIDEKVGQESNFLKLTA